MGHDPANGTSLERLRFISEWLKWLFAIVVSALLAYSAAANATNARITVLETQQRVNDERLREIKVQLDTLNSKIDRVIEMALRQQVGR